MSSEEISFQIILYAGNARSLAMEAVSSAKNKQIDEARTKIQQAKDELSNAHETQTDIIQKEVRGEKTEVTLLLTHAQDHFMNATTVIDLANEFVDLYEELNADREENAQ